jgi:hypothetical protein
MALKCFKGFSFLAIPFCYFIGFSGYFLCLCGVHFVNRARAIPRSMAASAVLLTFSSYLRINHIDNDIFHPFTFGALFMGNSQYFCVLLIKGTIVYFLGLLIISNKWYDFVAVERYLFRNFLALFSGVAAVVLG